MMEEDEAQEATPFLSPQVKVDPTQAAVRPLHTALLTRTVLYFMALHFLIAFTEMVMVGPLLRLEERSICVQHFGVHDPGVIGPGGDVPERLCKIPEVYRSLARIRGVKAFLDTLPVLLVAIPLGSLGDKIGRRRIMAISLVGVAASLLELFVVFAFPRDLPLEWVYLSSVLLLCGGGLYSTTAFMWAMASESVPEQQRSQAFYYIFSAFYIAELVASGIAALTLDITPWIGCGLAMSSVVLCLLLLWVMPHPPKTADSSETLHTVAEAADESQAGVSTPRRLLILVSNRNVRLLIPAFLVGSLRYTTLSIAVPYASIRFGVVFSRGVTVYTETAIINIILFLFVVPRATSYIRKNYNVRPQIIDRRLVQISLSLLCLGALGIGLSPSSTVLPVGIGIFAAGFGSRVSALSLISYWIPDESTATLYAAIAVIENLGHAVGDISLQLLFSLVLGSARAWMALPFFAITTVCALAAISTIFIETPKATSEE